jgi:hypothetical protein
MAHHAVELMYFDGCPNMDLALKHARAAITSAGLHIDVVMTRIGDDAEATRKRFLGSPTVHVDGLDVEPDAGVRDNYGLQCRVYWHDGRLEGAPPSHWIAAALAAGNEHAGPSLSDSAERGAHGCCGGKSNSKP